MSINLKFKDSSKGDSDYWRSLGVSIDSIIELKDSEVEKRFKGILNKMSVDELTELAYLLDVDLEEGKKDEKINSFSIVSKDTRVEVITLREFLNRKKKTIDRYYSSLADKFEIQIEKSQLCKLYQMLNDSIDNMIQIYTWYNWEKKGTGVKYSLNKPVNFNRAYKIPTKYATDFVDDMHVNSNKEDKYRIFSFGTYEKNKIVLVVYKLINDASRPDFDEPVRNKEVAPIMFQIDIVAGVLEIRSKYQKEKSGIRKYVEKTFNTSLTEIKPELFTQYQPDEIKSAFLEGVSPLDKEISDFMVNKMVFRSSPLINSPGLTFELENGDVLPSIKDAYNRDCIDMESIKDIESISFKTSNVSRTIRSTLLDEGNIMFSLDDSGMESIVKEEIEEKFLGKFGVPLNKLISNSKYMVGKADVTDYLMTLSSKKEFTEIEENIFNSLIADKIIYEKSESLISCQNPDCDHMEDSTMILHECPSCGSLELKKITNNTLNISVNTVESYVKKVIKSFCSSTSWELSNDTEKEYYKNKYKFINLNNRETNESLQILVHQGAIQNKVLEKINRTLTPAVIVFIGVVERYIEKYDNNCIFPVNFGRVYNTTDSAMFFGDIYNLIEHRAKSYLSSVAGKSYTMLKDLPSPKLIGKEYTPADFEDDVFNVLKDIFPNADKWGKEMSGKEVPEGIFALAYTVQEGAEDKDKNYVFSYDCKLNKNNKGYDLAKSEQRKAFDYVEMLNQIKYITRYSTTKQLSAHIFISNNFNSNNYKTMADHFYKKLPDGYDTRPIFLPLDVLIYLHSEYRKNYIQIGNSRNVFMEAMYHILITDKFVIDKDDIEDAIEQALDKDIADYHDIDTNKVRKDVTRKLKKR